MLEPMKKAALGKEPGLFYGKKLDSPLRHSQFTIIPDLPSVNAPPSKGEFWPQNILGKLSYIGLLWGFI